ncbi:small ubiquitin-related modifier 1-like [Herrania umbratica]|uniref:Small ubiquitin-related modifier 1-like n=1 Tax=Herrania umbratica TaxID=108875 RepID=A0A6J1AXG5_9ROSI|nr:small ubiquitin-related modifier 1-like [Herrania umbratica]
MSRPSGQASNSADGQPESIKITVKGQDGSTVVYKIGRKIKLSKLLHSYCQRKQLDYRTVRFVHEGHHVPGQHTADKLKLEDGAEIFCMFLQTGGGIHIMPKTT